MIKFLKKIFWRHHWQYDETKQFRICSICNKEEEFLFKSHFGPDIWYTITEGFQQLHYENMKIIYPYKLAGTAMIMNDAEGQPITSDDIWVFDDEATGLKYEAFISGTDIALDYLTRHIPTARTGFKLTFSHLPFDGYQMKATWLHEGVDGLAGKIHGNWYRWEDVKDPATAISGWLCPALFLYFPKAPEFLYVHAEELK